MLRNFKKYKLLKEVHEIAISGSDVKNAKDISKFFNDFKLKLMSETNDIFKEALIEALQELGVEVIKSDVREESNTDEITYYFTFKSKNIQYRLVVQITTLFNDVYLCEYLHGTDTFNSFGHSKNLRDTFLILREYEKVNDKMLYLSFKNTWNGKRGDVLAERIFFEKVSGEKEDHEGIPKRIYNFLVDQFNKLGFNAHFSSYVYFPYNDSIYKMDNGRIEKYD